MGAQLRVHAQLWTYKETYKGSTYGKLTTEFQVLIKIGMESKGAHE